MELSNLTNLHPDDLQAALRFLRVFGPKRLPSLLHRLKKRRLPPQWFVYVDNSGAKCFTHFKKLASPVKNPRSITGSQKYIVKSEALNGFLF